MVEAQERTVLITKKAKIYDPPRQEQDVERVLSALLQSLKLIDSLTTAEVENGRIFPEWLDTEFLNSRAVHGTTPTSFYLDPRIKQSSGIKQSNILSLEDVLSLFESIIDYIEYETKNARFGGYQLLDEKQHDLVTRIKNQSVRADVYFLRDDVSTLLSVLTTLKAGGGVTEESPEIDQSLPYEPYGRMLDEYELNLGFSWEWVKPFVEDTSKTKVGDTVVHYQYDRGEPRITDVKEARRFLNKWFLRFYKEFSEPFRDKGLDLPETSLFQSEDRSPAYFTIAIWTEVDEDIIAFIVKNLVPLIDKYLEGSSQGGIALPTSDSTEDKEKKRKLTEDVKSADDLDSLLEKFDKAGSSYAIEAERLTNALLPYFFEAHGFPLDSSSGLNILSEYDPISFSLIRREYQRELENVLRSLSSADFEALASGKNVEFRMLVLRKLYSKLGTNPRFIWSLLRYRDEYISEINRKIESEPSAKEKERLKSQLLRLNTQSNLDDISFDKVVVAREKQKGGDAWASEMRTKADVTYTPLQDLSALNTLTQADLQLLLVRITKNENIDFSLLIRNLDLIIAERWSPDQLKTLSSTDLSAILGINLSTGDREKDLWLHDGYSFGRFRNLLIQYLYTRRQRLADHYELDSISRDDGKVVERGQHDSAPTEEQKQKLEQTRALADSLQEASDQGVDNEVSGEAFIIARASDSSRVKEYKQHGHSMAAAISVIHTQAKEDRSEQFTKEEQALRNEFLAAGSIEKKIKLLQSLGYVIPELDGETGVQTTDTAKEALVQQHFDDVMADRAREHSQDLDQLSYFEDQDDGVVEDQEGSAGIPPGENGYRPAGAQRYGRPGKARSLARGALDVRKKLNQSKKASKAVKAAAKRAQKLAKKALDAATEMLPVNKRKLAAVGIFAGLGLLRMYHLWSTGGVFTKIGAVLGGVGGGIAGFFGFGPAGAAAGAFGGAWGGMELGYQADSALGLTKTTTLAEPLGTGGGGALPSLGTQSPAASAANPANAAVATTSSQSSGGVWTPGGALTVAATGGYTTVMLIGSGGILGAIQPPPLGTIGTDGMESPYVVMEKIATTPQGTALTGDVPAEVRYQLFIESRDDFQIEITGLTDVFSVTANSEARGNSTVPTLDPNACPDLSFDALKANLVAAGAAEGTNPSVGVDGVLQPGEVSDGRLFIGECTLNFDESFDHTGVQNIFSITFNAIGGSGNFDNQTAETTELVCFGDCPQQSEGDWPTTGTFSQGPFGDGLTGDASHRTFGSDALDITNRTVRDGALVKVFATYGGTAYFFNGNAGNPATRGVDPLYGWHIVLRTDQGFTLIYAHLLADSFQGASAGESIRVEACQFMGYMGSTGNSSGPHLHYEYRVSGRGWYSFPTGGRRLLQDIVPETIVPFTFRQVSPQNCR